MNKVTTQVLVLKVNSLVGEIVSVLLKIRQKQGFKLIGKMLNSKKLTSHCLRLSYFYVKKCLINKL